MLAGLFREVLRRIKDILNWRKYSVLSIMAAALILAVVAVSLLTEAAGNAQRPGNFTESGNNGDNDGKEVVSTLNSIPSDPEPTDSVNSGDSDLPEELTAGKPAEGAENDLTAKVESLLDRITAAKSLSSNPYEYIRGNEGFDELVSMGEPAMEAMFDLFAKHNEDGLREYVMAVACAKVLGVYDEERGIGTTGGREWFVKYGRFGLDDLNFVDADFDVFSNSGTVKEGISLPDRTDRTNMEEVISDYILARKRYAFYMGEKALEAHHIYRTGEADGRIHVYMLVRFGWFSFQDGVFSCVSGTGGIPARMELKKAENGQYEVVSYQEPMDGGLWLTSLKEMFPDDLVGLVTQRDEMVKREEEQIRIITQKAGEYLKSIGREDALLEYRYMPECGDDESKKAIYRVTEIRTGFPDWTGSREALVRTGGPYPGTNIRCIMETDVSKTEKGEYIVTVTRTWDIKLNGTQPISVWKYRVAGDSVSLMEEQNMDHLISLIK